MQHKTELESLFPKSGEGKSAMASEKTVIGWKVEFECGAIELHLGGDEPTVGRWITPLVAAGDTVDLDPDAEA